MREAPCRLPPRAARTFYNVADALLPPGPAGPGAGDLDLAPGLEARLARWGRLRAAGLRALLAAIEWAPRLRRGGRRGFSWLPRQERAARLGAWERSRLAPLRALHRLLAELVRELHGERSEAGPPHSFDDA